MTAHAIIRKTRISLEIPQRSDRVGAVDPIDSAAVKAEAGQRCLQFSNIIAAHVGRRMGDEPITEGPSSLDQRCPRCRVTEASTRKATTILEQSNGLLGRLPEPSVLGGTDRESSPNQAPLQVSDRFTAVTRPQWELLRNLPNSSTRADLLFAPTTLCTG